MIGAVDPLVHWVLRLLFCGLFLQAAVHKLRDPGAFVAALRGYEILPETGVYAGRLSLLDEGSPAAGSEFDAVTNVGRRPTFKDSDPVLAEAHLLDFDGDLYGRRVELRFLAQKLMSTPLEPGRVETAGPVFKYLGS